MPQVAERFIIHVAHDFSDTPGPRKEVEGPHSGEAFRTKVLAPAFQRARSEQQKLHVDLDGCAGFPTSFLEEAFGGLARQFGAQEVDTNLTFTSNDEPLLVEEIRRYIRDTQR